MTSCRTIALATGVAVLVAAAGFAGAAEERAGVPEPGAAAQAAAPKAPPLTPAEFDRARQTAA